MHPTIEGRRKSLAAPDVLREVLDRHTPSLLLVAMPGAPSSVLAPSSDALCCKYRPPARFLQTDQPARYFIQMRPLPRDHPVLSAAVDLLGPFGVRQGRRLTVLLLQPPRPGTYWDAFHSKYWEETTQSCEEHICKTCLMLKMLKKNKEEETSTKRKLVEM